MATGSERATRRFVHRFDAGIDNPALVGGKGASLVRMTANGLPTPPGFTITTKGWRAYSGNGNVMPDPVAEELDEALRSLERDVGRRFGDAADPLLVSVRSGAPVSMPGMMDTILNLGLSDESAEGLASLVNPRFAYGLYARLLSTFATVVRDLDEEALRAAVQSNGDPRESCEAVKRYIAEHCETPFPQDPRAQLREAVEAVWRSWDSRRARRYRSYAGIPDDLGTAVTVQAMVFGTYDERSGTGVVFTRDPATGSPQAYGDYLPCAQGEDVVAGGRNTEPLESMRQSVPEAWAELDAALPKLEAIYRDMCDIEFTVERGRLYILQARVGQRSGPAAVRIAVDLVDEGLIDVDEALSRIPLSAMTRLQAPVFAREQQLDVLGEGVPAAPGAACGVVACDADRAQELAADGTPVVLVRPETSPEDIAGMIAAAGIVTAVGGRTSHAAVVARGIGRPAVCGVEGLEVDPGAGVARFGDRVVREGETVAIDGERGIVAYGEVRLVPAQPSARLARVLQWCDERRRVAIEPEAPERFAVASSPEEVEGDAILIDVPWEGPESAKAINQVATAALERGVRELALRLPDPLAEGDLSPVPGPWTTIVASPESWCARLLAARIDRLGG